VIDNPAYLIADSSRLLRRAYDDRVRSLGVTGPQARLLLLLARAEGENQGYFAERLEVEPITLCRMVDRMTDSGLVERRRDPADRRAWQLHLTPRSRDMVAELRACVNALVEEIFGGVTAAERDLFVRVMQTLRGNLGMRRENEVAANG
jgi:DNA-binding MarR family transcriptional regulator